MPTGHSNESRNINSKYTLKVIQNQMQACCKYQGTFIMKWIKRVVIFCYMFLLVSYIFRIWNSLNLGALDIAGHITSAAQFARSGLHGFNDRMFLGTTQNLFYPPLEDILVNLVKLVSFQNYLISFKIYLAILMACYLGVLIYLGEQFKTKTSYIIYNLFILVLLNIDKSQSGDYQGLGFFDLYQTGLTNQLLSGIGLFLIFREILVNNSKSVWRIIAATIFSILSHIVVGFVSLILAVLFFFSTQKKIKVIKFLALILGLCSFYLIPFFYYKSYLTNSNIFLTKPWQLFSVAFFTFALGYKNQQARLFLFLSTFFFLVITVIPSVFENMPSFHYYRFNIIACFILAIGISILLNTSKNLKFDYIVLLLFSITFMGVIIIDAGVDTAFFKKDKRIEKQIELILPQNDNNDFGRTFLLSNERTSSTSIESVLTLKSSNTRFSKGLFWESSYTNSLESSFLATLLTPSVILNYFLVPRLSCEIKKCLMEEHFRIYNIKGLIGDLEKNTDLFKPDNECYQKMLITGTSKYNFINESSFKFDESNYQYYRIQEKDKNSKLLTNAVETISSEQIKFNIEESLDIIGSIFHERINSCKKSDRDENFSIFIKMAEKNKFLKMKSEYPGVPLAQFKASTINLRKLNEAEYRFILPKKKTWFVLKLSPQPGMVILDSNSKELPFLKAFPHIISVGSGEVHLIIKRTKLMWLSYIITFMTGLILLMCHFLSSPSLKQNSSKLLDRD